MSVTYIPKDKKQAEVVLSRLIAEGKLRRNPQAIEWWIAHWYMRGVRDFSNINYREGTLNANYVDNSGFLKFQYEEIVSKYQTQLGRLHGIDLAPTVKRKGISLDGMRKASIAQIVLDSAFPDSKVSELKQDLLAPLLTYGTVGLGLWVESENSMGIDVIMPWEILPIPSDVSSSTGVRGLIRRRVMPVRWVQNLTITPDPKNRVYSEMAKWSVPAAQLPVEADTKFQNSSVSISGYGAAFSVRSNVVDYPSGGKSMWGSRKKDETTMDVTEFAEIWTKTPDGYLAEYIVHAGGRILYRADHSEKKSCMPIKIISDVQVTGFWGRSYVSLLIPINTEVEETIARTFQNLQEYDYYGIIFEPTTTGVPVDAERGQDGLKRIRFEPDYTAPELKPYNMPPANSGTLPWRILEFGLKLMDRTANQPVELLSGSAPGRVDSASGLGTLYEASNIPLLPTSKNISIAVSGCYKALLGMARTMWKPEKIISISHLDDALAGIKLDATNGEMSLADNAIPHPNDVNITIAAEVPKSEQQQKLELKESLRDQIITPTEYRIEVRKRGLTTPVGNEAEWQNYRRAMLENLILFGDGKMPGQVIVSGRDMHTMHLMVLNSFMSGPEFYLASPAVRDKFVEHFDKHEAGLGILPEDMPTMEESAEETTQQMEGGGGEGGMPTQL